MKQRFSGRLLILYALFLTFILDPFLLSAQMGKNGALTTSTTSILNDYTVLTADVTSGSNTLNVASSSLNANISTPLAAGDLIYIIQMQGASMTSVNDSTYGSLISYGNCGNYEFVEVADVPSSTQITTAFQIKNNYSTSGKTQVIRVPRLTTLTIGSGGSMTCPVWNGTTGGVLILEVVNGITVNSGGTINATGKGFRGGQNAGENNTDYGIQDYVSPLSNYGAEKGEGVGGNTGDYDGMSGRYCKGAPLNGGGGADAHNAGGGGGGNCGTFGWTGRGVPDVSNGSWASAWNLEYSGFSSSNSSGGGKGGYSFSGNNQNALTTGPTNGAWGGDARRENGGRGGRPLDYSTGKIFMGGGGGAGDQNNNYGGAGGRGGGIIYLLSYSTLSGSGQITASGDNGLSTNSSGTDGAGGGGAGGTIFLDATGLISGVTANANGGNGGSQNVAIFVAEAEGPGGGGGGGYIATSSGGISRNANGGANGTTNGSSLSEFTPNGATKGGAGMPSELTNTFHIITSTVYICSGTSTTLSFSITGTVPSGITFAWYNQAVGGTQVGSGTTFVTPVLSSGQITYYVSACPGATRFPVQVQVSQLTASVAASNVCNGNPILFSGTGTASSGSIASWNWDFGDGTGTSSLQNPSYTYASANAYTVTLTVTDNSGCTATASQSVTVSPSPVVNFSTSTTLVCAPFNAAFANTTSNATSYSWDFGDGSPVSTAIAPSHIYATPGLYTVTLTASNGGCTSTFTQTNLMNVRPVPTASFTAPASICLGDVAAFNNLSVGNGSTIIGYSWNFGDATPASTATNPTHIYSSASTYNVVLTTSSANCSDDTTISVIVSPEPIVNFSTTTTTGCSPMTVSFSNTTTGGSPTYSWNFGDGSLLSSSATPTHVYSATGNYTVTLIATQGSCTDTLIRTNFIQVSAGPRASFGTSIATACLGDSIRFTNSSTGTITSYTWDFDDGSVVTSATGSNQLHLYTTAGTYDVHLTVIANGCPDDTTITINISSGPVVNFSASSVDGCGSFTTNFSNTTSGTPVYSWNFGDSSPLNSSANPSHTYNSIGTFTVTLIASQGSCADTLVRSNYITVHSLPQSSFSTVSVCLGDSVRFTDLSTGNGEPITGITWNYDDGNTSTTTSPHFYNSAGTFDVNLTVSTANCSDDTTISVIIYPGPLVNFSAPTLSGCDSLVATFSNTTTGSPAYTWNFGDGAATSSAATPTHNYTTTGTYSVTLIASQGSCADTLIRTNYITIYNSPLSSFSTADVCIGDSVRFTNLSSGNGEPITNYTWNYGDGNFSSQPAQSHYYTNAGTYNVLLSIITAHCVDDTTISVIVSPGPVAAFTPDATTFCGNQSVTFTNNTSGSPAYSWNFGDGSPVSNAVNPTHQYALPGTYNVSLIATQGSCADTLIQNSLINVFASPLSSFSTNDVCMYDSVRFQNSSAVNGDVITAYNWNFGDGFTSTEITPSHLYLAPGTYNVTLNVGTANCTDDTTITVTVNSNPATNFVSSTIRACDSITVNFNNTSTGALSYSWNFGDGNTSTLISPSHLYDIEGTYDVLLTATSPEGCISSKYATSMVIIRSTPQPAFVASRTSICPGECISYTDQTQGANVTWQWQLTGGNPSISLARNLSSVCYNSIGNYSVTLTVSNGSCTGTATQLSMIQVVDCNSKPQASFVSSDTSLCGGSCISFVDLSLNAVNWSWQFPGATPASSTLESPSNICYSVSGIYPVTLIASNTSGSDTFTVSAFISVSALPAQPSFTQSGNVLSVTSAATYQWYYNSIPISGATNQQYTATLSGPYSVEITDANGCSATSIVSHVSLVGIDELIDPLSFIIYPNPATNEIFIQSDRTVQGEITIEVIDLIGQVLISKYEKYNLSGSIWKLELSSLSQGAYFIRVINKKHEWKSLILKQ